MRVGQTQAAVFADHGQVHVELHTHDTPDTGTPMPIVVTLNGSTIARMRPGPGPHADAVAPLTPDTIDLICENGAATLVHSTPDGPKPVHLSGSRLRELLLRAVTTGGEAYTLPGGQVHLTVPGLGSAVAFDNGAARQPECRHCGWWELEHSGQPYCVGFESMTAADEELCVRCGAHRAPHDWDPSPTCGQFVEAVPELTDDEEEYEEDEFGPDYGTAPYGSGDY
ncbi:hypothetical protein ACFC6U_03100 [Kitasatospora purpeofusca]|uniref:hypothetical protein n=1 Tax=Kitasatospora purpeofusca TaxID=67352 RepID=UPI0035E30ED2